MRLSTFAIGPQRNPSTLRSCAWRKKQSVSPPHWFPDSSQLYNPLPSSLDSPWSRQFVTCSLILHTHSCLWDCVLTTFLWPSGTLIPLHESVPGLGQDHLLSCQPLSYFPSVLHSLNTFKYSNPWYRRPLDFPYGLNHGYIYIISENK